MATKADTAETLIVLDSFIGRVADQDRVFLKGQHIRSTDPAVKKWPHLFGPVNYGDVVEHATAAPGETR